MATNPMQRKARNSFLLGMLLMLIITGVIIAFLVIQLTNMKREEQEELATMVKVYTLNKNVTSGQIITTDMLTQQTVNSSMVPSNATSNLTNFQNYFLQDEVGNAIITKYEEADENDADADGNIPDEEVPHLYLSAGEEEYRIYEDTEIGGYYIERNNNREDITLSEAPLMAKVDMRANTVITTDLVTAGEVLQDSTRKQEFNMFILPTDLETGDYIDVRLLTPSGTDYIVVSKKQVEIPNIAGVDSTDTISIELNEDEINLLSNAIVDAFRLNGAKLYVNKYTDPGVQQASIPTYPVNQEVARLIEDNPNIVEDARNALWSRYNLTQRNEVINPLLNADPEQAQENLETNMEESITNSVTTRQEYLEGLSAQAAAATSTTNTTNTTNTTK